MGVQVLEGSQTKVKLAYNPAQARVPKGNPDGGQWVSTAGTLSGMLTGAYSGGGASGVEVDRDQYLDWYDEGSSHRYSNKAGYAAVRDYTQMEYLGINGHLRGDRAMVMPGFHDKHAEKMQQLFKDNAVPSTGWESVKVYRGLGDFQPAAGEAFTDKGFLSTSHSRDAAWEFGKPIEITVPPNTPFIPGNTNEGEMIFAPGSTLIPTGPNTYELKPGG